MTGALQQSDAKILDAEGLKMLDFCTAEVDNLIWGNEVFSLVSYVYSQDKHMKWMIMGKVEVEGSSVGVGCQPHYVSAAMRKVSKSFGK